MTGDGMQQLGADAGIERGRPFLDHPKTEMHVPEEPPFVRRPEHRAATQLAHTADIVNERSRHQQIHAQPLMELRRFAGKGGDADRVLEQSACVGMVSVDRGGQRAHGRACLLVEYAVDGASKAGVRDLGCEELEEAFDLVCVPAQRRRHRRRVDVLRRLERPNVELQAVAEPLDAPQHSYGVAFAEARIEKLDVVPHSCSDPSARVDELEREIRGAVSRAQPLLLRDRVDALDRPVLLELRDRRHWKVITDRMPSCASISSKPRLTSSSEMRWEMSGSTSISPPSQRSTSCGTWSRPLTPPNEEPATRRPVIRNRGTTSSVSPLPATPQTVASPHPIRADSTACRITATLPVASKV